MRTSSGRQATYFVLAALLVLRAQGFLGPLTRLTTPSTQCGYSAARRCRVPRLLAIPPGKTSGGAGSATAGGDENGAGFGADDTTSRITRAPLRITPNFQPQEKRRPKTNVDRDITYGAFLTEESFDVAAMAWAEFSDWLRRTIERNVDGAQFEFDIRQWSSSIWKWWSRAVEMDVQAKADFFRLYDRGMQERDAWGNQAVKVDARVEDEWDNIYVDCQDSFDSGGDCFVGSFEPLAAAGDNAAGSRSSPYSGTRRGGAWKASPLSLSAFDGFQAETGGEGEDRGVDGEGFDEDEEDEEDIIDCAIRGRWTFKNNDDPPHFSPQ